jgi:hypothetical protein
MEILEEDTLESLASAFSLSIESIEKVCLALFFTTLSAPLAPI